MNQEYFISLGEIMKPLSKYFFFVMLLPCFCFSQKKQNASTVIFDSDMGPDYDDVGAIAMLHTYADSGYIRIAATIASTNYEGVAAVFNVFNTYFKRPGIPIGVPKKNGKNLRDWQHWTDTLIARYPHAISSNAQAFESVDLYRKVLASQPDKSITIITTGFFTNLSALLQSSPDQYSKFNGQQLVEKKVKQLVSMAGGFPTGKEFNVRVDSLASQFVFMHWPTPILLSGFEIGWKIRTGLPLINNNSILKSPVKDVFSLCIPMAKSDSAGRMSWDETAVLVAVKGYKPWYDVEKGTMMVNNDGTNSWIAHGPKHEYLIEKLNPLEVGKLIDRLMMHQPK
jgi:inosine-uridine nucleoside N-ribohydrolase